MNVQSLFFHCLLIAAVAFPSLSPAEENDPPILVHQPLLVGIRGTANAIVAHATDRSGIASVQVTLYAGERSATGKMPQDTQAGTVPVVVRVTQKTPLLDEPQWFSKTRREARVGEELRVAGVDGNYYRIVTTEQKPVYIDVGRVSIVREGTAYKLVLPPQFCTGHPLGYRIIVTDVHGNRAQTERYDISFPATQVAAKRTTPPVVPKTRSFRPNAALLMTAGTLGGGGGIGYRFRRNLSLRATWNYFNFGMDGTYEDIDDPIAYDVNLLLNSGAFLLDFYPWGGGFHLTGGMLYNKNRISGAGIPAEDIEANGTIYTPDDVGELRLSLQSQEEWTPYVALGLGSPVPQKGVSFWLDIGGVYMGSPDVELDADQGTMIYPTIQNEAQMEKDLENLKWYIVVALGLSIAL